MTDHPLLLNTEMVRAVLDGCKSQTRRIAKESFVYSLTDDRVCGILTENNINCKEIYNEEFSNETNTNRAKRRLYGWLRRTDLLSNEVQRLWEKGVRGLVSVKRPQDNQGLFCNIPVSQQRENYKIYSPSCMYGISRNAQSRIFAGETFGWEPREQQARKLGMGHSIRELAGQNSPRQRQQGREALDGEALEQGLRTFEVGNQSWSVQPATGSKGIKNVSGWNISYSEFQAGLTLWVRETWALRGYDGNNFPCQLAYRADENKTVFDVDRNWKLSDFSIKWKPSIHMKKIHCRLWLEVVSVRVERVQDISWQDCKAEGIILPKEELIFNNQDQQHSRLTTRFQELWGSIYGEGAWQRNDWVWVGEFKRIEK